MSATHFPPICSLRGEPLQKLAYLIGQAGCATLFRCGDKKFVSIFSKAPMQCSEYIIPSSSNVISLEKAKIVGQHGYHLYANTMIDAVFPDTLRRIDIYCTFLQWNKSGAKKLPNLTDVSIKIKSSSCLCKGSLKFPKSLLHLSLAGEYRQEDYMSQKQLESLSLDNGVGIGMIVMDKKSRELIRSSPTLPSNLQLLPNISKLKLRAKGDLEHKGALWVLPSTITDLDIDFPYDFKGFANLRSLSAPLATTKKGVAHKFSYPYTKKDVVNDREFTCTYFPLKYRAMLREMDKFTDEITECSYENGILSAPLDSIPSIFEVFGDKVVEFRGEPLFCGEINPSWESFAETFPNIKKITSTLGNSDPIGWCLSYFKKLEYAEIDGHVEGVPKSLRFLSSGGGPLSDCSNLEHITFRNRDAKWDATVEWDEVISEKVKYISLFLLKIPAMRVARYLENKGIHYEIRYKHGRRLAQITTIRTGMKITKTD